MSRVLVVEDDPDIRMLVTTRLQQAGHRVRSVEDGAGAVDAVTEAGPPDLFVLDVGLPGMNGFDLLEHLRGLPGAQGTPAIFLSARVLPADIARGRALGAQYLTKPFVTTALLAKIDSCLATRAGAGEAW